MALVFASRRSPQRTVWSWKSRLPPCKQAPSAAGGKSQRDGGVYCKPRCAASPAAALTPWVGPRCRPLPRPGPAACACAQHCPARRPRQCASFRLRLCTGSSIRGAAKSTPPQIVAGIAQRSPLMMEGGARPTLGPGNDSGCEEPGQGLVWPQPLPCAVLLVASRSPGEGAHRGALAKRTAGAAGMTLSRLVQASESAAVATLAFSLSASVLPRLSVLSSCCFPCCSDGL